MELNFVLSIDLHRQTDKFHKFSENEIVDKIYEILNKITDNEPKNDFGSP